MSWRLAFVLGIIVGAWAVVLANFLNDLDRRHRREALQRAMDEEAAAAARNVEETHGTDRN